MRVSVVTDDAVLPSKNGGRLALLHEITALRDLGVQLNLVVTHHGTVSEDVRRAHAELSSSTVFLSRSSFLKATLCHPLQPYQFSSRLPNTALHLPPADVIIAHHEWTLPLASSLAGNTGCPIVLRSHNDERLFLQSFARSASGLRKVYTYLEFIRATRSLLSRTSNFADEIWPMSTADRCAYKEHASKVHVVPPVLSFADTPSHPSYVPHATVGFIGALDISHTVSGLRWFVSRVWPLVRQAEPTAKFVVAGRNANEELRAFINSHDGCRFVGSVASVGDFLSGIRVFVNPILDGSGVNMKLAGPCQAGVPIVSTEFGIRGLEGLRSAVRTATSASEFSRNCVELLQSKTMYEKAQADLIASSSAYTTSEVGTLMIARLRSLIDARLLRP